MRRDFRGLSLFTNCGAGDLGFSQAGFRFNVLAELDPRRLAVAKLNHPHAVAIPGDLRRTWGLARDEYRAREHGQAPDLLAACPPCQGMSSARGGRGRNCDPDAGSRDSRNLLVIPIINVVRALRPRIIVIENVTAFLSRRVRHPETSEPVSAARLLVDSVENEYEAYAAILDLADYGVPQNRRRCFLTFIRRDEPALESLRSRQLSPYPNPTHGTQSRPQITLGRALASMRLSALDAKNESRAQAARCPMHRVPVWGGHHYRMVASIPKHSGLSAWENNQCSQCGPTQVSEEDAVCNRCGEVLLRPTIRDEQGGWRLIRGFRSTSYRRMKPNQPSSTITTASGHIGSDLTLHPWENRVLSPLECAGLQTIPRSFKWGDSVERFGLTFVREMIGEAVPPRFTERHGRILAKILSGTVDRTFLKASDERCSRAREKLSQRE
jgi:DNA (cytosine-5)-methyltransferase 1